MRKDRNTQHTQQTQRERVKPTINKICFSASLDIIFSPHATLLQQEISRGKKLIN